LVVYIITGSIEKEGNAKELKFFIRGGSKNADGNYDQSGATTSKENITNEERVFIHPSSVGSYSYPWLVYHRLMQTLKAFLSDATEIRLSANARIGSLIGGLRQKVDELLEQKISNPSLNVTGSTEMNLITE